jgi:hypothetical protein
MALLAKQLDRQESRFLRRQAEDTILRHEQANMIQVLTYQNYCMLKGVPMDTPPKPMYDTEQERASLLALETEDIHATSGAHRAAVQRPSD